MSTNVIRYDFKAGLSHEFEVIDITELYKYHKHLLIEPHRTSFYHIIWFQGGTGTHLVDFKPIKIKKNSVLFVNKNKVQRFDLLGKYKATVILFTDNFFCRSDQDARFLKETILFNDLFDNSLVQLGSSNNSFETILQMMISEISNRKDAFKQDILKNLLHNFLLFCERAKHQQGYIEIKKGADLDYTLLYKDLLEINFKNIKQVSYYAKKINVTEKRLNNATSKVLGITPKEMIDERILLEAKRLLSHTTDTIKEIGFQLGFEEPTNFIKYFRRHCDCTPVEFREQYSK